MAYKTHFISIFVVLLSITGQAVAGRNALTTTNKDEKKHPEWLLGNDGSYLIPGIGRVVFPPLHNLAPVTPFPGSGSTGSTGSTGGSGKYIPGGDDTFVPNPGYEVPNPANGAGSVPASRNSP